jgi:hypothetical protein
MHLSYSRNRKRFMLGGTTAVVGLFVLASVGPARAQIDPKITATWVTGKGLELTGTGFSPGDQVELTVYQNDEDLPYGFEFDADSHGNFSGKQCANGTDGPHGNQGEGFDESTGGNIEYLTSCTAPIYLTAACEVSVSGYDVDTGISTNTVYVTITSKEGCPGPKFSVTKEGCKTYPCSAGYIKVTGSGFTPGGTSLISVTPASENQVFADPTVSGTLKPGGYSGGNVSYSFPTGTGCGKTLTVWEVDDVTDADPNPSSITLPAPC